MNRYPGIRPFRTDERHLFFGRSDDTERLYRLLRLEQLVVLYGKSGYGKSSLLRAGIYPRLEEEGRYRPWEIRFGPCKPGESPPPAAAVRAAIAKNDATSVWEALKSRQTADNKRFILFFDQFEELFTYPPDQIETFKQQLAEALFSPLPPAASAERMQGKTDDALLYQPFELKVLFSIRADRLSLLNQLKDYFPDLLRHTYQLDALDEKQAAEAVARPAALPQFPLSSGGSGGEQLAGESFSTPPFTYSPEALRLIFNELRDPETGRIETSALQIVCKHAEDNIVAPQSPVTNQPITISAADLGDLKTVFRAFYDNTIAGLTADEREPTRRLVEDRLIKDGIRLPFAEQALLTEPGITSALLEKLERASLLRVELDEQRRKIYEIGHDTLVAPISEAAAARREAEEKERLRREADEQRREKEKAVAARRRARLVAAGAVLLSLFAIGASYFAWLKSEEARRAADVILQKEKQVESARQTADQKTAEAETYLKTARDKEEVARQALVEVENEKNATAEQKRLAEENFRQAQAARIAAEKATENVVRSILREAERDILKLDYAAAYAKMTDAARLGQLKPDVARALMEIAYFRTESGQFAEARDITSAIAALLASPLPLGGGVGGGVDERQTLRQTLQSLDPARYAELERRYYPVMISLPGGAFLMGCDTARENCGRDELPRHPVRLDAFRLAETETTFWQYGLYCAATGLKVQDASPSWGIDGNNPVVNVSWYDACLYLNWLSERNGLRPAYLKDSLIENSNGFRLPTEAEWEYAAKGGPNETRTDAYSATRYAGSDSLDLVGWYGENSSVNGVRRTHQVAQKMKNAAGFFDMSGNVWEWCHDWYDERYYKQFRDSTAENPRGPESGSYRVLRGGSWYDVGYSSRVANRLRLIPNLRNNNYGFRAARH